MKKKEVNNNEKLGKCVEEKIKKIVRRRNKEKQTNKPLMKRKKTRDEKSCRIRDMKSKSTGNQQDRARHVISPVTAVRRASEAEELPLKRQTGDYLEVAECFPRS